MNVSCYLIVEGRAPRSGFDRNTRRVPGNVRITKGRPNTTANEIAVKLNLEIPDGLFIKPTLEATVSVPDDGCRGPAITAEVADNIAEVIRERTGLHVHISADPPDGET